MPRSCQARRRQPRGRPRSARGGRARTEPRARARWSRLRAPEHPLERRRHPRVRRCRARCSPPTTRPARSAITYALKSAWATSTSLVTASARRAIQYFSRQTGRLLEPGGFAGARGPILGRVDTGLRDVSRHVAAGRAGACSHAARTGRARPTLTDTRPDLTALDVLLEGLDADQRVRGQGV